MKELIEDKQKLKEFYGNILEFLDSRVQILSLRPKLIQGLESYFEGDFDFLISKEHFKIALDLIYEYSKEEGVNFTLNQKAVNKKFFRFFINDVTQACLTFEFWTAIEFTEKNKKCSFPADSIFQVVNKGKSTQIEILALIYITHLYHKNKDIFSAENQYRFDWFLGELAKQSENSSSAKLLEDIRKKEISIKEANKKAVFLLKSLSIRSRSYLIERIELFCKKAKIKFISIKNIVPVVGPDGVGKGVVSDNSLSQLEGYEPFRFKSLYRIRWAYKLRLMLIKGYNKEPKNRLDEKISYYIFFISLFTFQLLRYNKKNKVVLMDRYFVDYFGTPIRYLDNNKLPKKLSFYNFLLFLTPLPNKMIFMGCKDVSLIARKNELSLTSVDFLQHINSEFILKKDLPEILFLSTENDIDTSSEVMRRFLEEHKNNLKKINHLK